MSGKANSRLTVAQKVPLRGATFFTAAYCDFCEQQAKRVTDEDGAPENLLECPTCGTRWLVEAPVVTEVTGCGHGDWDMLDEGSLYKSGDDDRDASTPF